jgi:structural maintenance of chromosome 1
MRDAEEDGDSEGDDEDDARDDGDETRSKGKKIGGEWLSVDAHPEVDYAKLSRRARSQTSSAAQQTALAKIDDDIKSCESQLESLSPNMRATEHVADVSARLEQLDVAAEAAKSRAKAAVEEFETVKEQRQDRFNACFAHVADKICDVYKHLTKSNNYPMGGTAYLSVEQQDEPYLAGVKFNAMPPTKRFRDMEQLSGGERTVAALSLLFAIHDFKPSPFFILDEVDAALDTGNVSKLSTYVQLRAPELQTIVITLKDAFFEKADALVGIYRDTAVNASRILTLDMTPFDTRVAVGPSAPLPGGAVAQATT